MAVRRSEKKSRKKLGTICRSGAFSFDYGERAVFASVRGEASLPSTSPTGAVLMSQPKVRPIPEGMHSLTPHIICAGAADAIEFYKKAFQAVELMRLPGPNGKLMHASVRIGDSMLMLVDESPEWGCLGPKSPPGSPVYLHLQVEDVDAVVAQAVAAGAKLTLPVADMFWGDRYGQLEDPFGHRWSVATHTRDLSPEEVREGMVAACG
jgi:PhnB protein